MNRRDIIKCAATGLIGVLLDKKVYGIGNNNASIIDTTSKAKAKSIIQIFLWGGMSHNDTWDYKDSGQEYQGTVKRLVTDTKNEITNGLSEWFPELGKQSDKFSLIRSMTHRNFGHETAAYLMQTAHAPGERLSYPSVGAVFAWSKQNIYKGIIPPVVVLTQPAGRFSEEGFLGPKYKPFATGGDPNALRFSVEGITSPNISDSRQIARKEFLEKMDVMGAMMKNNKEIMLSQIAKNQAYELILGKGKEVFDLSKESEDIRNRYGRNTFGQDCLVSRRLVEAGVPYIVINYPAGWDSHKDHFQTMRRQTPNLDQGVATLLQDLSDRGLLESTIVWVTGEFGRTPKVDYFPPWNGGRGHYGNVFSVLVAGGGFKGGRVVGSSDDKSEEVKERPVYPFDLLESIYKLSGINPNAKLPHPMGMDAYVLPQSDDGVKSTKILTEIM